MGITAKDIIPALDETKKALADVAAGRTRAARQALRKYSNPGMLPEENYP